MRFGDEEVGETQEVGEEGEGGVVGGAGGVELEGQVDAFAGDRVVESIGLIRMSWERVD